MTKPKRYPCSEPTRTVRHGLRSSGLPPKCEYISSQLIAFRGYVLDELRQRDGRPPTMLQEALLQSAIRHETRALLSARWLRREHDRLSLMERLTLLREVSSATDSRDKCLSRLGLDRSQSADIIATLYQSSGPLEDSTDAV